MAAPSISDLTATSASAAEPAFVAATVPRLGGVDPLGLRQINFDLMDQVFPGLNNVARHVRPFVVVTWAWRRAGQLAQATGSKDIAVDDLRDFVDRIEVIYAWSQFLRDPNADLPGRQVLSSLIKSERWSFGGHAWRERRKNRRDSTAFTAPITYGPALKTLGWISPHEQHSDVFIPSAAAEPALNAFEAQIASRLKHPAFNQFGKVEVTAKEALAWSKGWALERITRAEQRVMAKMVFGAGAPLARQQGGALMLAAAAHSATTEPTNVRLTMAGAPSNFIPSNDQQTSFQAWRRTQIRQLFRLGLEALLYWIIRRVQGGPRSSDALVHAFLKETGRPERKSAGHWLKSAKVGGLGPTMLMDRITAVLDNPSEAELAAAIADSLAFCLAEAPEHGEIFERADRLPLFKARREAEAWANTSTREFVRHVIESWILAQHVYWSVGRGLADARARGKSILRLKVVLEEGGWRLAPGAGGGSRPVPTPDRLGTMLNLASECGLAPKPTKE